MFIFRGEELLSSKLFAVCGRTARDVRRFRGAKTPLWGCSIKSKVTNNCRCQDGSGGNDDDDGSRSVSERIVFLSSLSVRHVAFLTKFNSI